MTPLRWFLVLITVAGLAVDAWVHWSLASAYDPVRAGVSQGQLFRVEAVVAVISALALLLRPNRWTAAFAALVAGGGLLILVLLRYVDVGALGPFPDMYEPYWYLKKTWSAVAQGVATVTALVLVVLGPARPRDSSTTS